MGPPAPALKPTVVPAKCRACPLARPSAAAGGGSPPLARATARRGAPGFFVQLLVPDPGLDVVAVGVEDECRIPVFLAEAGRAIVLPASGHRGAIEGVDGGFVAGLECDVGRRADLPFRHPEVVPSALDETERVVVLPVHLVSQRRQRLLVEPAARARIAAAEADVLDHAVGVRRARRYRNRPPSVQSKYVVAERPSDYLGQLPAVARLRRRPSRST